MISNKLLAAATQERSVYNIRAILIMKNYQIFCENTLSNISKQSLHTLFIHYIFAPAINALTHPLSFKINITIIISPYITSLDSSRAY